MVDKYFLRLLEVGNQFADEKREPSRLSGFNLLRRHFVSQDPGVVEKAEALLVYHILASVRGELRLDLIRLPHSFKAGLQCSQKVRQRRAGKSQESKRLRIEPALNQTEFAVLTKAFEAHHQLLKLQRRRRVLGCSYRVRYRERANDLLRAEIHRALPCH